MQDAWRAYMELALGLTEASRKKATKVAKQLVGKGGATAEQLQTLAEDLVKTSTANREAITKLVRYELDRALGMVGLATAEEVAELSSRVRDLEQQVRQAQAAGLEAEVAVEEPAPHGDPIGAEALGTGAAPSAPAGMKAPAKKAGATKAAPAAAATKTAATKTAAKRAAPAKKTVTKKAVAKKAIAKKAAKRTTMPETP